MDFVCTRLRNDVDDAVSGPAHFCRETRGRNLKPCDGILGEIRNRTTDNLIIVVSAIHEVVPTPPKASGGTHLERVCLGRVERGGWPVARNQERKFQQVSAVQWKLSIVVDVICPWSIDCVRSTCEFVVPTSPVLDDAACKVVSSVVAFPASICTCG